MLRSKTLIYFVFISSLFAKDIIAVLDLETIGLNPGEATILTQRLTTKLISIGKYEVVERTNIDKILSQQYSIKGSWENPEINRITLEQQQN